MSSFGFCGNCRVLGWELRCWSAALESGGRARVSEWPSASFFRNCILSPVCLLCLSQLVWHDDTGKMCMSLVHVLTSISREVLSSLCQQFCDLSVLISSQGRCLGMRGCGQLRTCFADLPSARLAVSSITSCGMVLGSLVSLPELWKIARLSPEERPMVAGKEKRHGVRSYCDTAAWRWGRPVPTRSRQGKQELWNGPHGSFCPS